MDTVIQTTSAFAWRPQRETIRTDKFSTAVTINSEPSKVWAVLTDHKRMSQWMADPEMKIEVHPNWEIHTGILVRGCLKFENKGIILAFDTNQTIIQFLSLS